MAPALQSGDCFNMLTAIQKAERSGHWLWRCQCGTEKVIRSDRVRSGYTKSCGCARRKPKPSKPVSGSHLRVAGIPTGILLRAIPSRPKEIEPGPLSVVERQIILRFADRPATVIARLLNRPMRVVREQIKLLGDAR
jgi:hypothetical protein